MNINLTPIIQAIIALLAALVTYRLIPWIKARTTQTQQANMRALYKVLVFAAEQLYGAGNGKQKLEYVKDWLEERGYDVNVAEIEAAVGEYINHGLSFTETIESEAEIDDDYELPPLEEWPLEMIVDFCRLNGIPHAGCETKDDYIKAIVGAAKPAQEEACEQKDYCELDDEGNMIPDKPPNEEPRSERPRVFDDDSEEPESTPEAEG